MHVRPLILSALAAAMAVAAVPSAAMAQANRSSVSYNDLDLSSEAGRAELGKRFDQAALEMCGVSDSTSLKGKARYCYETNSKSMKARVASILSKHDEAQGG